MTACNDIKPEVGITGTPVIDKTGNIPNVLYVVTEEYNSGSSPTITQRLHALNIFTGADVAPYLDIATAYGGPSNFAAGYQNQRPALALTHDSSGNPLIYVAWASNCDITPYTGKAAVFTLTGGTPALSLLATFDVTGGVSGATQGGIWMGGGGPAIDDVTGGSKDVYLSTGNGNVSYGSPLTSSALGMSMLRLDLNLSSTPVFSVVGAYTPNEYNILNNGSGSDCSSLLQLPLPYTSPNNTYCIKADVDLDSGGVILARPTGSGVLPSDTNFVYLGM